MGMVVRRYIDYLILLSCICSFLKQHHYILFIFYNYRFKQKVRMQSKNSPTIAHTMAGMCGMHKLCVLLEDSYRTCVC